MSAAVVLNCSGDVNTRDMESMDAAFPGLVISGWQEYPLDGISGVDPNLEQVVESMLSAHRTFREVVRPMKTEVIIIFPDELREDLRQRIVRWLDPRKATMLSRSEVM